MESIIAQQNDFIFVDKCDDEVYVYVVYEDNIKRIGRIYSNNIHSEKPTWYYKHQSESVALELDDMEAIADKLRLFMEQ